MPTVYSPPVSTYVSLATVTLASTETSVTFSSIPATYRDLVLIQSLVGLDNDAVAIGFNGVSYSTDSSYVRMRGDGSTTNSFATSTGIIGWAWGTNPKNLITQIMDYSATDKHKTTLTRSNNSSWVTAVAHRWANTSAINSLTVSVPFGNPYGVGSVFSLYGIAA